MQAGSGAETGATHAKSLAADDLLCGSSEAAYDKTLLAGNQSKASVVLRLEVATSADTRVSGLRLQRL